jgi:hypothetical protein
MSITVRELRSLVLLHYIATGGALELAQLAAAQERQRRLGGELLSQLPDRRIDPRAAESQLADMELDLAVSVAAALRPVPGGTGAELGRRLARARVPHLLLQLDRLPDAASAARPGRPGRASSVTLSHQAGPSPVAYPAERSIRRQTGPFRCQFQTGTRPGSAPRTATSSRS